MFRENATPTHLVFYLAGVGTAVLVVIFGWLLVQTVPVAAPVAVPSDDGGVSILGAASTEIDAVDRKLLDEGYHAILLDRGELDPLTNVHPADRKFFGGNYAIYSAPTASTDPLAGVDPADRKFFKNGLLTQDPLDFE